MRLAIMQPYFFPYLGYFALIANTDKFVVFDTPQFIRHGWIERNRILKPGESWQYIKVPLVKHKRETSIKNIRIRNNTDWKNKIVAQLNHYKKKAKYYNNVIELINEIFKIETESITKLNVYALQKVCEYLEIDFNYSVFSEMDLKLEKVNEPDEWALQISKALNANQYINLPGGESFFDKRKYQKANVELKFLQSNVKEYKQGINSFEPGLSIVDVMMFNSPEEINEMLNGYEFV